jgi:hypothetical protein
MISIRCGGLRLVTVPEGGAPLRAALTVILETSQECGAVWRVQRSPRTREREREMGVLSGLVVPATRELLQTRCSSCRPVVS